MTTLATPFVRRSGRCQCGAKWSSVGSEEFANAIRDRFRSDHSSHRSMKPPKARRKASDRSKQRREADTLFSRYIRLRDRCCQNCLRRDGLQCAHLVSRRYLATRWNPANAVALDASCHKKFTENPLAWDDWCRSRLGARAWAVLQAKAQRTLSPGVFYYAELIGWLRAEIAKLEEAA